MNTLGLYIHIPFCKSKCRYCDFCSFPHPKDDTIQTYTEALVSEIKQWGREIGNYYDPPPQTDTVFFGGGTPTLLPIDLFKQLTDAVKNSFSLTSDAEITAECNPATADRDYLRELHSLGINRLSIGAQSMNDGELKILGRLHKADDFIRTFRDARAAGFDNLSADIMFGIPSQTPESLAATLNTVTALGPEHISVYGLQVEEGTYFARHQDELSLPDEETERQMYMDTVRLLAERGLVRYEISNFSRPRFESRHNLKYWHRHDYLGMGLAAHSCIGNTRFSNTENLSEYLACNRLATHEVIGKHDILCERIMLGMRLDAGVNFEELAREYGDKVLRYQTALAKYIDGGFVKKSDRNLAFTDRGMYVSNTILADVLDFDD